MNDERSVIICFMVFGHIPCLMGSLHNSPCKKTSDWSKYVVRCPANHTIYITKHVIEDGFNTLKYPALGCSVRDAFYCGVELPTNNTISLKNHGNFESAVNKCNERTECTLKKDYFQAVESSVRISCDPSKRPELKIAQFRQSVNFECIQDSLTIDMCLTPTEIKSHNGHLYLKTLSATCSCSITGRVDRLKILQAANVTVLIQSNMSNIFEHRNADFGLYGADIPDQTGDLVIKILSGSNTSLALLKVHGNYSITCNRYFTGILRTSSHNLNFISTTLPVHSGGRGHTQVDMSSLSSANHTIAEVTVFTITTTRTSVNIFSSMTGKEPSASDVIITLKSWISILMVILVLFVSLVIFLSCFYFIKQRKDRYLLLKILQRLSEERSKANETQLKTTELHVGTSQLFNDDPNYQEISINILKNPRTKQQTNPTYAKESSKSDTPDIGGEEGAMVTSIDDDNKYFELEKRDPSVMKEF